MFFFSWFFPSLKEYVAESCGQLILELCVLHTMDVLEKNARDLVAVAMVSKHFKKFVYDELARRYPGFKLNFKGPFVDAHIRQLRSCVEYSRLINIFGIRGSYVKNKKKINKSLMRWIRRALRTHKECEVVHMLSDVNFNTTHIIVDMLRVQECMKLDRNTSFENLNIYRVMLKSWYNDHRVNYALVKCLWCVGREEQAQEIFKCTTNKFTVFESIFIDEDGCDLKYALSLFKQAGFEINEKIEDFFGDTLLHLAAKYNYSPNILKTLIKAGADLNAKNNFEETPIDVATKSESDLALVFLLHEGKILSDNQKKMPNNNCINKFIFFLLFPARVPSML